MGNAISDLIGREALISKSLIGRTNYLVNLNKLRGLYSSVQNSLKSLTLNNEEFEEIFECHCFSIWDNDANGLINPLEVIAGITMLSNTSSKDKFQFLFGIFDFNQEGEITICDLKFILHLCILSVCKIFGHSKDMGMNEENEVTANRNLNSKINLNEMLLICAQHPSVAYFLNICEILKTSSSDIVSNSSYHHQYYD